MKTIAKSGDIAAMDVVVPQGNTGQPPGPFISQLNGAGLPTRIESGSVWVAKDTLVARKGEAINERVASVLSKLGIKAVEAGLSMRAVYDEGLMVLENQLKIDVDATRKSLQQNQAEAFALALEIAYHNNRYNKISITSSTPESSRFIGKRSNSDQRNNRRFDS